MAGRKFTNRSNTRGLSMSSNQHSVLHLAHLVVLLSASDLCTTSYCTMAHPLIWYALWDSLFPFFFQFRSDSALRSPFLNVVHCRKKQCLCTCFQICNSLRTSSPVYCINAIRSIALHNSKPIALLLQNDRKKVCRSRQPLKMEESSQSLSFFPLWRCHSKTAS